MAELTPAPFNDLVTRLFLEPRTQDALFELPRRKWYLPRAGDPDLGVTFHGKRAGNACGPAAGPHTQMAQNLLLSYAAGGRILELKTVQVNDRLTIGRPCIDITNVGYNIEWSQELLVEDSLREYVAGAMLIEMFRHSEEHTGRALDGSAGEVIHDISVGYDLAGIRSEKVRLFLAGMRDASAWVARLRDEIPATFAAAHDLEFPTRLSDSITLSTFHGCPADEIERICEFLIGELDFDVIVKMNPPTLGKERLEHLLYDVLGYRELTVNPTAYGSVVPFAESVQLCERLTGFARARGRRVGFKFSNTLEVTNHRDFFTSDNQVMYLSGQPLHVITMTLTDEFRRAVGPDVPISFSAGVDQHNFPLLVACGFVPITTSTDLLRPGGYGRLPKYLEALTQEMKKLGATTVDEYIVRWADAHPSPLRKQGEERASHEGDPSPLRKQTECGPSGTQCNDVDQRSMRTNRGGADVRDTGEAAEAGWRNTTIVAEMARNDYRYRAERNRAVPKRIDSHLTTFDCITCDKCLPVCPNAANFTYPTPKVDLELDEVIVSPDGRWRFGESRRFAIEQTMQIACYADFCNECGNCDTFCPEYGGPYIKKPSFFGSLESWTRAAPRDGFVLGEDGMSIRGRIQGREYAMFAEPERRTLRFEDEAVALYFSTATPEPYSVRIKAALEADHAVDPRISHTLRYLLMGMTDSSRINQVNARWMQRHA